MNDSSPAERFNAAFYEQVVRYLDGKSTADELVSIERDLVDSPERRQVFIDICLQAALIAESSVDVVQGLQQTSHGAAVAGPALSEDASPTLQCRSPVLGGLNGMNALPSESVPMRAFLWTVVTVSGVLTAMVVLLVVLTVAGVYRPWERVAQDDQRPTIEQPVPTPSSVVRLARTAECTWADEDAAPAPGSELASGCKLQLTSGLAELLFHSGATVLLQGPASFEIGNSKSGFLHQGSLTVTCGSPAAKGFTIDTPGMKYTDLGTEFGVMVAKGGGQEVHVFRGQIAAEPGPTSPLTAPSPTAAPVDRPQPLVLSANQAIRIAAPGKSIERIAADEKRFVRTEQMTGQIAKAKEDASLSEIVVWKEIGEAKGVVGMAAAGEKLFAATADKKLLVCDTVAARIAWRTIGDVPDGIVAMGMADGKLFVSTDVRSRGRLLMRDAVETSVAWKDIGHAWCLLGMAGSPGRIYAIVDTKEPGSQAGIMVRDSEDTPDGLAKAGNAGKGLDGLPWNGTGFPSLPGMRVLATVDAHLYVLAQGDKLYLGDLTNPATPWQAAGEAPGAILLAGGNGKLFAATKDNKLLLGMTKKK